MQTQIIRHHSLEEIRGYIHDAETILSEAGYDDAERIQLLPTILTLLGARTITISQPQRVTLPTLPDGGRLPR